jgi:methylated-DNA-[protein]-cysteine S-methyltransferase
LQDLYYTSIPDKTTLKFQLSGVTLRLVTSTEAGSLCIQFKFGAAKISWNTEGLLTQVDLDREISPSEPSSWVPSRVFKLAEDLNDYFGFGSPFSRVRWEDIDTQEWTEFQYKVYRAILSIPHGETRTYGWVAMKIGTPLACRAVGQALRKNPVPLLVPCHRVVSPQSLGGFMGQKSPEAPELGLKRQLLDLENRFINPCFPFSA